MATTSEAVAIAIQHHQAGRLQAAEQVYRQVLTVDPNRPDVWHLLGVVSAQLGRFQFGVECIGRALAAKPDWAEAHSNLGNVLWEQGKLDQAEVSLRRALQLKPDCADAHNNLGNTLKDLGRPDEAVACYRHALQIKPDFPDAHNNLGIILREQGKLEEGIACFQRALQLKPDYAQAHNNLGLALKEVGRLAEAVGCYQRALQLNPDFAEAHTGLGDALTSLGKLDEAIDCHRRAVACCRRVLQTGPRPARLHDVLGKAFGQLAIILGKRLPEDDLTAMRQLLSEPNFRGAGRIALQLGLAQALDAKGGYDEAAEHLRQANALRSADLRARNREYRPAVERAFVDAVIATFTPQLFARANGFGLQTDLPVFIFGLPRSGTTLAEQILASHSQVFGAGELPYCEETLNLLPKAMVRNDTPLECLRDLDRKTAGYLAERHVDRLQALDERALRIVDKMPDNYHRLGLISILFPQARLIHCRRDLRDVALSCWMTNFASLAWAWNPDHIAFHFEAYRRLMDHWQKVLPLPLLDVDYEEMVQDMEGVARRIVKWCGLEWEPGCLKFHQTQRPVRTASAVQVRRPIYQTSVGRWKNYEKSMSELFSRLQRSNFGTPPKS
ncbi:MAG: tetratricopeptide repeat protein [Thermoguttaceae bacterium]|jgi:tetratricopeptide (TPR) repeat protein